MGIFFKEKPNSTLLGVALFLAICSSSQNGYVSSVLNIPQNVVETFVNQSNYDNYGQYMSPGQISLIWSLIVTQRQLGQLVGTIAAPFLCGWLGRKGTILFNTLPLCLGLFIQALSKWMNTWPLLLVGRFIWSCGGGVIAVVIPMFFSEISPNKIRGGMASLHGMMLSAGSLVADVAGLPETLGTASLWPFEYFIVLGLQLIQLAILPFFYESPKDLYIRQNRIEKSVKSLMFYHRYKTEEQMESTLHEYKQEKQAGHTSKMPLKQLWSQKDLRMSVVVGIASTCCYAFGGMQIVTNYTTAIFESTGVPSKVSAYCSLAVSAIRFFAVFPSIIIVEKLGRRPLLLFSVTGCLICFVVMLVCQVSYSAKQQSWQGYLIVATTLIYGFIFSIGCQTIGTFLPSEVVPTQQRAANQSVAVMFRFLFALITTFLFLPLQRAIGGFCWLELIIPLAFTIWFVYRCMPETKDRTILDILAELNGPRSLLTTNVRRICCNNSKGNYIPDDNEVYKSLISSDENGHVNPTYGALNENSDQHPLGANNHQHSAET